MPSARRRLSAHVHRASRRQELQAEAEGHAKSVVTGIASVYLPPAMKINPSPAGFVVPFNRLKLQNRPPASTGSTKSNMTATELSCGGTAPRCGSTPQRLRLDCATGGARGCRRADQGQELHD
jgi:hypothetical protein